MAYQPSDIMKAPSLNVTTDSKLQLAKPSTAETKQKEEFSLLLRQYCNFLSLLSQTNCMRSHWVCVSDDSLCKHMVTSFVHFEHFVASRPAQQVASIR
ncbi:hypothetical protein NEOLI_004878 [Neolecta irregularis DAH-3]|uniref:Uncharacterized protein n=1 Tax=Neolecta irregularis (strain DAH-3) TaxID=1198029 RepID=A0A1U7LKV6_NEOID|nr:hypothetical protein NEOLI_004878 [Neolecta irregularis DAH-3]|eukprot:OLL23290.1 hypothetical protein NEOLI_004878 [Neolecta irregularis DAH-3]